MTIVVVEPTLGCRQLADRLDELGYEISKSTVQRILVDHGLGHRRQRVARAAALAALVGLVTEPVTEKRPSRSGSAIGPPNQAIWWRWTASTSATSKASARSTNSPRVDTCTRWAIIKLIIGPVTTAHTIGFIDHVRKTMRRLGIPVTNVLTDNGPEYNGLAFRDHLADLGLVHVRIPPRSPNHNAVSNASKAPCSKNAGDPRSTAATS